MDSVYSSKTVPNFKARHLLKTSVLKKALESSGKRLPEEAHVIEMSFLDSMDAKALETLKHSWLKAPFAEIICSPSNLQGRKIYAITTQKEGFEEVNPDKILGIADFYLKEKNANLRFLQANPRIIEENDRSIVGIGKAFMQGLAGLLKKSGYETMDLYAEQRVKPFYQKTFPTIRDKESTMESYTNLCLDL